MDLSKTTILRRLSILGVFLRSFGILNNTHPKKIKNEDGFTLIEVVAVATIMGVLALIAMPVMKDRLDDSKDTQVKSNLRSAAVAVAGEKDNNGYWKTDSSCISPTNLTELISNLNNGSPYQFTGLCSRADAAYWLDPTKETLTENQILVYMPLGGSATPGDTVNLLGRSKTGQLWCVKLLAVGPQSQGKQDNTDYDQILTSGLTGDASLNSSWPSSLGQCTGIGWT